MATTTSPAGERFELGAIAATWRFASFYRQYGEGAPMIKYHRAEASAARGQWDSASQRKEWIYAGYAPIVRD